VLDFLDPGGTLIDHRLYRSQALLLQGVLVKNLRLLSGRDLRRTVIVENTMSTFAFQLDSAHQDLAQPSAGHRVTQVPRFPPSVAV